MLLYFVAQRYLYEFRERSAKTYSWQVFMISNIVAELPWNVLGALFIFVSCYYPAGLYRNAEPTNTVVGRGGSMYLIMLVYRKFSVDKTFPIPIRLTDSFSISGSNVSLLLEISQSGKLLSPPLPSNVLFYLRTYDSS
jgi:hypothetical protein